MYRKYYCQGCRNEKDCPEETIQDSITHDCYESDELDYMTSLMIKQFMQGYNSVEKEK